MTFNEVINDSRLTLVRFQERGCMQPLIEKEISELDEFQGYLNIFKVIKNNSKELFEQYEIVTECEFILFINGIMLWKGPGSISKEELICIIRKYISEDIKNEK